MNGTKTNNFDLISIWAVVENDKVLIASPEKLQKIDEISLIKFIFFNISQTIKIKNRIKAINGEIFLTMRQFISYYSQLTQNKNNDESDELLHILNLYEKEVHTIIFFICFSYCFRWH